MEVNHLKKSLLKRQILLNLKTRDNLIIMSQSFFSLESVHFFNSEEIEQNDPRINRSFESLITERSVYDETGMYSLIFKEIKNKLFNLNEINEIPKITDEQKKSFEDRYYSSELSNNINRVKKLVVNFYNKKIELEIKLQQNKENYEVFCKNISDSIKSIDSIISSETEEDSILKNCLMNRINWYYSELKIDSLKKEYSDVLLEYSYIKDLLQDISSLMPCGICQICLEKN